MATRALAAIESIIRLTKELPFVMQRWFAYGHDSDNILMFKLWSRIIKLGQKHLPLWDVWQDTIPALAWVFRLTIKLETHAKTMAFKLDKQRKTEYKERVQDPEDQYHRSCWKQVASKTPLAVLWKARMVKSLLTLPVN